MRFRIFILFILYALTSTAQIEFSSSLINFKDSDIFIKLDGINLNFKNVFSTNFIGTTIYSKSEYNSYGHEFQIDGESKVTLDDSSVDISDLKVTRPHSGDDDLLPFAYGDIGFFNEETLIERSTGNFTVGPSNSTDNTIILKLIFDTDLVDVADLVVVASAIGNQNKCAVSYDRSLNSINVEITSIRSLLSPVNARPAIAFFNFIAYKAK